MKSIWLIAAVLLLSACATKQYPQASAVTDEEAVTLNCQALKQEIVKTRHIQQEIAETGSFDYRTVLGFMGDLGIGNGLARHNASEKAKSRLAELQALRDVKCLTATDSKSEEKRLFQSS
ncbi:MAG: hypothetical protein E6559_10815 [Pantoea sp.]|uniref:hypothetical protein n=1 Tax=Pantoea septica TaxID=472695 RepID=UPI001C11D8AA|nr:hypothetical protein [Pantoea septica]MBU5376397.1 hypothetical protein [Pantoea septica]MDU5837135.1 hypothetical protein [Pantoea sp.]MDU6440391.1 hypothetical protein [Pantoea sp.]